MKKNNKKAAAEALIVAGVFFLILAIVLGFFGLQKPVELKEVGEVSAAEMNADYAYHFDELTVIDYYMKQSGGNSGNGRYYIAAFTEGDVYYLVSIYAENDMSMEGKLRRYADDDNATFGDLVISGCFSSKKVSSCSDDMIDFYDDAVSQYTKQFKTYLGAEAVDLQLHLTYVCEDPADYEDSASGIDALYIGIAFLVLGALILFFGIRMRKKAVAEIAAREAFNRNQLQAEPWNQG